MILAVGIFFLGMFYMLTISYGKAIMCFAIVWVMKKEIVRNMKRGNRVRRRSEDVEKA